MGIGINKKATKQLLGNLRRADAIPPKGYKVYHYGHTGICTFSDLFQLLTPARDSLQYYGSFEN